MKIIDTSTVDPENLSPFERDQVYNGLDCCVTSEVLSVLKPQLDNHTTATYAFSRELQGPVLEMRLRGVLVDQQRKAEVIDEYFEKLDVFETSLETIVRESCGIFGFNWRSPTQLQELFYDKLRIPPVRWRGKPTVNRAAIERIECYPIAWAIVQHITAMRDLAKKISVLKTEIDPDGRMRTSYNIGGTTTGRLSSSYSEFGTGTNLQNIEEALRSVFIADPGMKMGYADAEQGESRVVGAIEHNLFGDDKYLDACEGGDLHTAVAKLVWPKLRWTGNKNKDKDLAEQPFYRHYSRRFMCKKIGHGCLTTDHEVLTKEGWVPIETKPDNIMIWDSDISNFDNVLLWTDYDYTGELHSFEGNSISALMTPDHRVPFTPDHRYPVRAKLARNGPGQKMPLGDNFIGGDIEPPARLIAAFMADGNRIGNHSAFHFQKERKVQRLLHLCEYYDYECDMYNNEDGTYKLVVKNLTYPKHPGPFIFDWCGESIRDFIDELKYWDGYIGPTAISISAGIRTDLEWYQTLGRLVGVGGAISKPYTSGFGSTIWRLQQNQRKWASGSSVEHSTRQVVATRVLCPTVSTGWFYVRRNGKIFVTGNSNYGGKPGTLATQAKVERELIEDFQPKYFGAFPAHNEWHEWTKDQLAEFGYLVSLTDRKRYFRGRKDDDSTFREAVAYQGQALGDILNRGMLNVWRQNNVQLLMQIHDAILFQYPEEQEDEIIPLVLEQLKYPIQLERGRELVIPYDCKTGWNFSLYCCGDRTKCADCKLGVNVDGLKKFQGHDKRKRTPPVGLMDQRIR